MQFNKIVVASHGTPGARAAEELACVLSAPGGSLHHLYVVPEFWKGMLGDDWLNNAITQDRFGKYVESQLGKEIDEARERVSAIVADRGLRYCFEFRVGRPADSLLEVVGAVSPEVVVIGSPRPKGSPGLRSRMDLETLVGSLPVPVIIAPYPKK